MNEFLISPDPDNPRLSEQVSGIDENNQPTTMRVPVERPLTLFLNAREIVTMMTIGDYPDYLAAGFLRNQNMLHDDDEIVAIDYEEEIETVVVRTAIETDYEEKLQKKIRTSGCAQGTIFGDVMDSFEDITLSTDSRISTSTLRNLSKKINITPSLYLEAGAIHGCVLCEGERPLLYMEDVGRHNAVDKISGYMFMNNMTGADKILYTTGRLTSEMVLKAVQMQIPILVSRSGFTAWGVELARQAGLTLIGRAKGKRFVVLSGESRLIYDAGIEKDEL